MTKIGNILLAVCGALAMAGCETLTDTAEGVVQEGAGAQSCRQAGPHEAAAPGEWLCPHGDGERARPRHRVAD